MRKGGTRSPARTLRSRVQIGDGPEHCEEERFRANAQRRSGMEVVVPSGTDAPVTDDAGDEHQG